MNRKIGVRTTKVEQRIIDGLKNGISVINILPVDFTSSDVVSIAIAYLRKNHEAYQMADYYIKTKYSPNNSMEDDNAMGKAIREFMKESKIDYDIRKSGIGMVFLKKWDNNTTFDLDSTAYEIVDEFRNKYMHKYSLSDIVKRILYAVLGNIDYCIDMLSYYLLASSITLVSLSFNSGKYLMDNFKQDVLSLNPPGISTTPYDLKNYDEVYKWITKIKYFNDFKNENKKHELLFAKWIELLNPMSLVKKTAINYNEYNTNDSISSYYSLTFFYPFSSGLIGFLTFLSYISNKEKNNYLVSSPQDLTYSFMNIILEDSFSISLTRDYERVIQKLDEWVLIFKEKIKS